MPGEGQKIDRILEKYAERYYAHNPNSYYVTADVAYMVSFGLILLNTDLHNPMNKVKITCRDWKKNLRTLSDDMKNFDDAYLDILYDKIAAEKIKFIDDELRYGSMTGQVPTVPRKILPSLFFF